MIPLRIVETEREDFDGPIVELWRDDEFIGMVFWDGATSVLQVYPSGDGDVHDLEIRDLLRVLDTAERMVDPTAYEEDEFAELQVAVAAEADGWQDEDPATLELVEEFDPQAVHRSEEGEGYFTREVADEFIRRCEELGLAVVEVEGFDWDGEQLAARPGLVLTVRPEEMMTWPQFRTYANARAGETIGRWPRRDSIVLAFVVQQPDGETIVA
jgi:hypothetical protein